MKAAALILIVLLAAACGGDEDSVTAADTVAPVAEPLAPRTSVIADTEAGATVVVVLEDNTIGMPTESIGPGPAVFTVRNAGQELHGFAVKGDGVDARIAETLSNGQESTLEVVFTAGSYRAWCPLHEDQAGEAVDFQVAAR